MGLMDKYIKFTVRRIDLQTKEILEEAHTANHEIAKRIRNGYEGKEGSYAEIVDYKPSAEEEREYNKYHYIQAEKILKRAIGAKYKHYALISKLAEICEEGKRLGYL